MADEFFDGYIVGSSVNGDNNNGFGIGIAIALFIFLYPYLPFMVVGYELGSAVGNGVNIVKWGGAIIGLAAGAFWYLNTFRQITSKLFGIQSGFLYWLIAYLFATALFWVLGFIYQKNSLVTGVLGMWSAFFGWATSVS
jgi:hypothetical protein